MKKKTLGRITALGIAALTAVPTFSIVASAAAEMSFTELYNATYVKNGVLTTEYYDTQAHAQTAINGQTDASGNTINPVKVTSVSSVFSVTSNKFNYDPTTGLVTPSASGAITYKPSSVNMGATGVNINNITYRYADPTYSYRSEVTGLYYPNIQAMQQSEPTLGSQYTIKTLADGEKWSLNNKCWFDYSQGVYTNSGIGTDIIYINNTGYTTSYSISSYNRYASNTVYVYNGVCYPNYDSMVSTVGSVTGFTTRAVEVGYTYTSSRCYFDPASGRYYTYSNKPSTAVSVSAGKTTGSYTVYYSPYTGRYYDTLSAANAATPTGYTVRTITNSAYSASYLNTYGYGYGYYNGYYNGYYDPNYYYYYYLMGNNGLTGTAATTTNKDTSTVTIGKYTGWTNVIKVINAARVGASYAVNMKSETEIPESVLTAMKGKNVNILFTYSNGAVITINGNDITSTTAFSPSVRYGSTSIPSTLKKKAVKANSGVSSSQFTINGGSFGAEVSVTVKFNSKRAGCSAKLYRYNAAANTLSLVSRSAVQSNGQCKFDDVKQGGEYIVVLS